MGRGSADEDGLIDDPVAASAWEEEPPRVPVFRWRLVGSAVMVLVVAVAAWWSVTWLMRPSSPESVPIDAQAVVREDADGNGRGDANADVRSGDAERGGGGTPDGKHGPATGEEGAGGEGPSSGSGGDDGEDRGAGDVAARVRVHVIGEVRTPGVVTVPADARTADAIAAAGGAARGAQTERINLAAPLVDGQQVLVPGADTTQEQLEAVQAQAGGSAGGGDETPEGAGAAASGGVPEGGGADSGAADGGADGGTGNGGGDAGAVDLNTADSTALQTLPGVGPATAEKIIAHREQVGQFQSLTDLDAVSGIGPATLERLAPLVTW